MSNIVEVVVADKNLATMLRSVKAAELATVLSKTGPFSVTINGAKVQGRDSEASNGVVHSLDALIDFK